MATDEARRADQHDSIKSEVVDEVNNEIAERATGQPSPNEARRIEHAAGAIREHAVDEVIDSERAAQRSRGLARFSQFVDYAFFLVYALLAVRFFLAIVGAQPNAGFVRFVAAISDPLYAPFRNIVESPAAGSGHVLIPAIIAMLAYGVLHLAINRALRMVITRKTEI
ncbi:MAG: YggT family protein [Myxococcota bacterium]|nr:YggT family protein [Myxococcota bacterium]